MNRTSDWEFGLHYKGDDVHIIDNIFGEFISEHMELCPQGAMCFREGSAEVNLLINGSKVTINVYDERPGDKVIVESYPHQYTIQGLDHYKSNGRVHMVYEVRLNNECNHSKNYDDGAQMDVYNYSPTKGFTRHSKLDNDESFDRLKYAARNGDIRMVRWCINLNYFDDEEYDIAADIALDSGYYEIYDMIDRVR